MRPIYVTHDERDAVTPNHLPILEADVEFDRGDIWDDEVALFGVSDTERAQWGVDADLEALAEDGPEACTDWCFPRHAPEPSGRVCGPRGSTVGGGR